MDRRKLHFVWLDRHSPLGDNNIAAMPPEYAENVAAWSAKLGPKSVLVANGAACVDAIRLAESLSRVDGLWLQYKSFASRFVRVNHEAGRQCSPCAVSFAGDAGCSVLTWPAWLSCTLTAAFTSTQTCKSALVC